MENWWLIYKNQNIGVLHEIGDKVLYQIEGTTECKYALRSEIEKESIVFNGKEMCLPPLPVQFVAYEGEDTSYLLCNKIYKVNTKVCDISEKLKPGEIFLLDFISICGSDLVKY